MKLHASRLSIRTLRPKEHQDLTSQLDRIVRESGVEEGLCHAFVQHTTAALAVNESNEGTAEDLLEAAERMVPKIRFRHAHDPSHAPDHIASALLGPGLSIPVSEGRLALGTYQRVLLLEFNGPRERSILVRVLG